MSERTKGMEGTALWRHITDRLGEAIESQALKPGDLLPSEHSLMSQYGVSRNTVRRALGKLRELGKIEIAQGKGAFVRGEPLMHTITVRTRLASSVADEGLDFDVRILAHRTIEATTGLSKALKLATGEPVAYLRAVTSVEGIPVSCGRIFHPARRFPDIAEKRAKNPDIATVFREYGIQDFVRRVTYLTARMPSEVEATMLEQDTIDPVMISRKIDIDADHLPIEFNETVWAARRIQLCLPTLEHARKEDAALCSIALPD